MCTQTQNSHCSGNPITVTLTDECPGACNNDPVHFDLSGIAYGKLAKSGEEEFQFFIKVVSEAVNGDGDLSLVEIKTGGASTTAWTPMKRMIGSTWNVGIQPNTQKPPFSLRLTSSTKKSVIAQNVIPPGWQPRSVYKSNVNFPSQL
ncbi:hypothetical protein T459_05276 [Capsicum annuum]|uniref:Uncharacterized protein n=1 Tax=Capsicum annuum TaxID=4072 RepID=A0A2G3A7L2_CAPAN|nr:hypothetical protein T459_05276 [Capsicum annuum]